MPKFGVGSRFSVIKKGPKGHNMGNFSGFYRNSATLSKATLEYATISGEVTLGRGLGFRVWVAVQELTHKLL